MLIAHIRLAARHSKSVWVNGMRWEYCCHRSHYYGFTCWTWSDYDGFCARHNRSCYTECETDKRR